MLVKKQSRLDVRKFSFPRVPSMHRINHHQCVHASGINMFKNIIDKYLVKAGYTYNKCRLRLEQYA